MNMTSLVLLLTVLGLGACCAPARPPVSGRARRVLKTLDGGTVPVDELEAVIRQAMEKANVAGLSVAIINDGRIVYTHAFGYRDKAAGIPFDTEMVTSATSLQQDGLRLPGDAPGRGR